MLKNVWIAKMYFKLYAIAFKISNCALTLRISLFNKPPGEPSFSLFSFSLSNNIALQHSFYMSKIWEGFSKPPPPLICTLAH